MLRMGSTTAGRADSLLLTGAETAIANKKLGEIRAIDTSKCSLTLTVNMEPEDEKVYDNEPLMNRMNIILTESTNEIVEGYSQKAAKTECPLIMIFAGICSVAEMYKLEYMPNMIIYEKLEGAQLEKIKVYDEFDSDTGQPSRHYDDDIIRYSKAINRGFPLPATTKY